ncbi:RNA polymerase sigma factor (sigma-70 family) [Thermocatellispora tengchongensis]|uniref:RNA polymerase sigma factor (Sigma-70 family) n=1 Tax=Thermocatellispora tengchongensis TaxID=1073253 RepID=A0A840P6C3_9ACTN|nr:sigma-70 family RNA polymerase sigma factor [Thermocatellispora tengchongensis]MBB5135218.1 RNA polymerase sigma factor (sigma-70 family) [Thermocatellispora tengchongensis]
MPDTTAPAPLLRAAAEGDRGAWDRLVETYSPMMWACARAYGLASGDADDAVQAAWLRLLEHITAIHTPEALGRWLLTTTRHEALHIARGNSRVLPAPEPPPPPRPGDDTETADPLAIVLDAERRARVWHAVARLHEPCRSLLRLVATDPDAGTHQIALRLGMPRGSVGPTRSRCLRHLSRLIAAEDPP